MRKEISTTPLTAWATEREPIPALVYFLPQNGRHGAMQVEIPVVRQAIEQTAFSEPNWDGYGALAIGERTKENALTAITTLLLEAPAPEVTPNPNGTFSFEWETQSGTAHLEIGRSRFSFYINPRTGLPILFEGSVSQVSRLHGSLLSELLFPEQTGVSTATPIRYLTGV